MYVFKRVFLGAILLMLWGCGGSDDNNLVDFTPVVTETEDDRIIITDQTDKEWDVSDAVRKYGFDANSFQFGLGPFAIPPLADPSYLDPSDPGYPSTAQDFLVIGTNINEDIRAYPIFVMKTFEIVNEHIGGASVAVAY